MTNQYEAYQMAPVTTLQALKHDLARKPRRRGLTPVSAALAEEVSLLPLGGLEALLPHKPGQRYTFSIACQEGLGHAVEYVWYDDGYETPDDTLA